MIKLLATCIVLLSAGLLGSAQVDSHKIDGIVQNFVANRLFEGTVLVADGGKMVYHDSFGFKDADSLRPVENTTRFGIASITKMFTALVILQLVEEEKIELNNNLNDLLPNLKIPRSKQITVHHLLLHISGLPNENQDVYTQLRNPRDFVEQTMKNKSRRIGRFNYANLDYILLGLIIEKCEGITWEMSVQRRILDKALMEQTGFLKKDKYPADFAYSFSYDENDDRKADPLFYIENFFAAGCMYSSARDLLRLDQAMYSSKILSEESKALMFTSYPEYNYSGYSVWTYDYPFGESKPRIMERRGGILGANSVLIRMIDINRTLIILSNNDQFNPDSFGDTSELKEALMVELSRANP